MLCCVFLRVLEFASCLVACLRVIYAVYLLKLCACLHLCLQAHSMQKRAAPTSKLGMSKPYLHLDIKREVLQQQLPLERDELVTVPISVRIGESPMDGEAHCKVRSAAFQCIFGLPSLKLTTVLLRG